MRRPGPELLEEVSEGAMYRLGRGIATCLARVADAIEAGVATGTFHTEDVDLLANTLYAAGLGGMQLARVGMLVRGGRARRAHGGPALPRAGQGAPGGLELAMAVGAP